MFSQFAAYPGLGPQGENVLSSDNVVNATRDGTCYRTTLTLDNNTTSGTFPLYVVNESTGQYEQITISPVYDPGTPPVIDAAQTAQAIQELR